MNGAIWPGFVDAMTSLLLVLMFVLSIFMIMQSILSETITGQENELDALTSEVNALAQALGLEQQRSDGLQTQVAGLTATLEAARDSAREQSDLIAALTAKNDAAVARIASFEDQVASLIAARDAALGENEALVASVEDLQSARAQLINEQEAMQLALAKARDEIDASSEAARLAAARREALQALIAQMKTDAEANEQAVSAAQARVEEAEAAQLADAAALEALRARFENAQTELTAMTLALEEQRKQAEETLTLLAAARSARDSLSEELQAQAAAMTQSEKQAALLATARAQLAEEEAQSAQSQRQMAALNAQVADLRSQLSILQGILDESADQDSAAQVQIDTLTSRLNAALARVASEERKRAALEEAERKRLERYQSEFFGKLRDILGDRDGVRIVGDRFVFSSEVLFQPGAATLSPAGRAQIAQVAGLLQEVAAEIPPEIDWVIRVDGHTDITPLSGTGLYRDNWELSQARALSVVRFMTNSLGFPPERLAPTGFGEYQPVAPGNSPEALAQNRRIELKLTEK
ncbi:putative lipoprotein YiaD precursor [Aquimixticola soesokkakensis]|uniref:Putative lipoprotein YiaD n=2 Tax=Aquimixticola soesokkakensis TaxID=1519096 RepID=A0A1Y5RQT3_9RHOB|nr:putative lipoprotein YiaD precursor [Aquimixticola soesokkakensis]